MSAMRVEIKAGSVAGPGDDRVVLDGHDVTNHVQSVTVTAVAGELTTVDLRLVNLDVLTEIDTEHITVVSIEETTE